MLTWLEDPWARNQRCMDALRAMPGAVYYDDYRAMLASSAHFITGVSGYGMLCLSRRHVGDAAAWLRVVDEHCDPMPGGEAQRMLNGLRVLVSPGKASQAEIGQRIAAFLDRLPDWPGDAAYHAAQAWADTNDFFPSWRELAERMAGMAQPRITARTALRRLVAVHDTAEMKEATDGSA